MDDMDEDASSVSSYSSTESLYSETVYTEEIVEKEGQNELVLAAKSPESISTVEVRDNASRGWNCLLLCLGGRSPGGIR